MNRRRFVESAAAGMTVVAASPLLARAGVAKGPPFRTLYSNDTTHLLSCLRPEHRDVEFTDEMPKKSITQAALN